jgi:hypothetical protein
MMAAGMAAAQGATVTLLEKNEKLGKKLYITGKGRCNLTNAADKDGLQAGVAANPRFLHSAFTAFGSADTMEFFEKRGVRLQTERGRRVFPASGRASDVTKALEMFLRDNHVTVALRHRVTAVNAIDGNIQSVHTDKRSFPAGAVIIATGGLSYPSTGSTGDGYAFARTLGHEVQPTYPSLVPLLVREPWVGKLAGLSLKNIGCRVLFPGKKKPVFTEIGEMLFTPDGITGPLVLSASRYVTDKLALNPFISLDLKPGLNMEKLDTRIQRDAAAYANRNFRNALQGLLPERLIEIIVDLSGISPERKMNSITRQERQKLAALLKDLPLTPLSTAGYNEAVITMGGVDVREINPSTLMSKKTGGLFFAGEVLDVDAMTGGYNLQIAFSTGYLAGKSAGRYVWVQTVSP